MKHLALLSLALIGCVIGAEKYPRPRDLPVSTHVDRTRILAVQAEPPEVQPGEIVTFRALVADPRAEVATVVWAACEPDESSGFGCPLDFSALQSENPTPEDLEEAGIIGVEPFFPPAYVPDPALLDGLEGTDLTEGVEVTIMVVALPALDEEADAAEIDFNEVEAAYKRLVVSEALTPNANPGTTAFTVDGIEIPDGAVVEVDRGQVYELGVAIDEATIETYQYLDHDGEVQDRVEEPYVSWYATSGQVTEAYTLHPYTESTWVAGDRRAEGTWYAVVRDRRGGMSWRVQRYVVR